MFQPLGLGPWAEDLIQYLYPEAPSTQIVDHLGPNRYLGPSYILFQYLDPQFKIMRLLMAKLPEEPDKTWLKVWGLGPGHPLGTNMFRV